MREIGQFIEFVDQMPPQNVQKTTEVLDTRVRLTACIQNLKEKITWTEMLQDQNKQTEEGLEIHEKKLEANKNFTIEFKRPTKTKKGLKVVGGVLMSSRFVACFIMQPRLVLLVRRAATTHGAQKSHCQNGVRCITCISCSGKCNV